MELDIKVLWCKGLTAFNFFQKLTIYATVSISSEDERVKLTQEQKQEQKTVVDDQGDGNPEWNHTMKFDLDLVKSINPKFDNLSLVFEFRHQAQLFPDRTVGQVSIPLRSLIESVGVDIVRYASYEVRNPERKHNGALDFSYKIVGNVVNHSNGFTNSEIQISGYNQFNHSQHWEHSHDSIHSGVQISEHHHIHTNSGVQISEQHHHIHANSGVQISEQHHHIHTNSGVHISAHNHSRYDYITHHQNLSGGHSFSDPEKIQYPKLDLGDFGAITVGGNVNESLDQHAVYPPPQSHVVYPPPPQPQWASQPPQPPHYSYLPPPPPVVYPPPPRPSYMDPHWGYHRPSEYQQRPDGGYHHW